MLTARPYQQQVLDVFADLGLPPAIVLDRKRPLVQECADLVSIGPDMFGREQRLERRTAERWLTMQQTATQDQVTLLVVSAFRSLDYQRGIISRKLASGQSLDEITRVSALPGFSEHHSGRAIDIGTPGCPPVVEAFAQTPAFAWLFRRAQEFGFYMSYPKDNPFGVVYEPWHWAFHERNSDEERW